MGKAALAVVLVLVLAGCASDRPQRPGGERRSCDGDWHSPIGMILRYKDKDGNVTRADLEAGLRTDFAAADTNHDGVLEKDEVRAVNEQRWSEDRSAMSPLIDLSGSGVVDFAEFAGTARSLFDQLDASGSGVLTARQLMAFQCGPRGGGGKPGVEEDQGGRRHGGGRGGRGGRGSGGGDGDDGGYNQ